ncbi:MAG: DUF2490 domain-containing protein [Gammaproteobacteria bacterium]
MMTSISLIGLSTIIIFFTPMQKASALEQNDKLWLGVDVQKPLSSNKKWLYLLYAQTRLINQNHAWQTTLFEGGVGYVISPNQTLWLGYRWSGINPYNGFSEENRLWQQLSWRLKENNRYRIFSRTRLEESTLSTQSQLSYRLRQRVSLELLANHIAKLFPLLYDEAFFQLNKTQYTSHQLFSQNRLFLGFKLYTQATTFWEIGYINQYQWHTPSSTQNQMNHIISFNYSFI